MLKDFIKNNFAFLALFVVLSVIPVFSLFSPGLPITHDGPDHVARIMAFYQNLTDGVLIPRWGAILNWGYGHPILEFLYPFPSYIASLFHFLGFSFMDATKIVYILGMVLSFLFMYLWLKEFLSKSSALLGAVLFSYAPYRFIDLYVRGDIGENLAFAFIPLSLYFIYKLSVKKDFLNLSLGAFSIAFLILSHNAIALISVPVIFLYGIYLWWRLKFDRGFIIKFLIQFGLGFTLSMFFWLPGLLEGKYTLRNIVTFGAYKTHFVKLSELIYGPWSFGGSGVFSVQIGIIQLISIIASPFIAYKLYLKKDKNLSLVLGLLVFTILSIFIMTSTSDFIWSRIIMLQNFQFPWRFLGLIVFTTAVLGALLSEYITKRYKPLIISILIILAVMLSFRYTIAQGYYYTLDKFENGLYKSTTDTGESSPIWSVRFMERFPKAPIEVIEGKGSVKETVRKTTYRKYEFKSDVSARILVNILYFPNWTIYVDGKKQVTQFQDPNYRGLMTFIVTGRPHLIEAKYENTKLRTISDVVSLGSLVGIFAFGIFRFTKAKTHRL
ncbi:MAG: glycosyltransferase family 39 protein [Candidatus Levybacteria bacterium]|nr:glycosyltransferase family 39 protein [Candidatus Levybacteria bacterium]